MPEIHEREEQASVTSIEARNNLNQPSPREETVQSKTKINTSLLSSTEDLSKLRIRITKRGGQSKSANPRRSSPHPVKIEETQPRVISLRIPDFYKIDNDFKNPISIAPKYGKGPMADVSYMSPRKKSIPKRSSIKGFNALETVSVIKPKKTTQATDAKSPMAPRHKTKYSGAKINPGKEFIGDTFSAQCHHVLNPSWEEKLLMKINYNPNQTIYKSYGDIKNMLDTNYMLRRSASKAIFQSLMNKTARS